MCRATYGQLMLDEGIPLEVVSVLLGHSRSETTEGYYARVRNCVAVEDALGVWYDDSEDADPSAESDDKLGENELSSASAKISERGGIRGDSLPAVIFSSPITNVFPHSEEVFMWQMTNSSQIGY